MRVEIFVQDKDLAKLHWLLDGIAVEHPKCTPVRNAEVKKGANGELKVRARVRGSVSEAAVAKISTYEPGTELRFRDITKVCTEAGGSNASSGYALRKLQEFGVVGKKRQDGTYLVLSPKK